MYLTFKKIIFTIGFNSFLFLFLIVGIQNSAKKSKVILFSNETIELPISFIVGVSFIAGSFSAVLIPPNFKNKNKQN